MTEKEKFIEMMKERTMQLSIDIIQLCNQLKESRASSVINYQLVKSATSVGANYRAACRGRSKPEFFSKICIVVEEADETEYWLEIISKTDLFQNVNELNRLRKEANEITRIMTKAKNTTYK